MCVESHDVDIDIDNDLRTTTLDPPASVMVARSGRKSPGTSLSGSRKRAGTPSLSPPRPTSSPPTGRRSPSLGRPRSASTALPEQVAPEDVWKPLTQSTSAPAEKGSTRSTRTLPKTKVDEDNQEPRVVGKIVDNQFDAMQASHDSVHIEKDSMTVAEFAAMLTTRHLP